MSERTAIVAIVALALVVVVALIFNRRLWVHATPTNVEVQTGSSSDR